MQPLFTQCITRGSLQGTDQSFLEKLHHQLAKHPHFIKGGDKRQWAVQFGVHHYAGPVTYHVKGFLDKNKDVQQEMFFDFLEQSTLPFCRQICTYRVRMGREVKGWRGREGGEGMKREGGR